MADIAKGPEYTVANPHPGHGVDPNIINEFGHTVYPKYIDDPSGAKDEKTGKRLRIIVKDEAEEKAALAGGNSKKPAGGWPK